MGMIWQCSLAAQRANCILDCKQSIMGSGVREGICPLLHSSETPSETLHIALGCSAQEGHKPVGTAAEDGHKDGLEYLSHKGRLRELGWSSLEKKKLWRNLREPCST